MTGMRIVSTRKPLLKEWFGRRFAWETHPCATACRPKFWHNPGWRRVRVGSRRRQLVIQSEAMRRRALRQIARNRQALATKDQQQPEEGTDG